MDRHMISFEEVGLVDKYSVIQPLATPIGSASGPASWWVVPGVVAEHLNSDGGNDRTNL
jgi:hypothetical protein